jgi:hypothetical protein
MRAVNRYVCQLVRAIVLLTFVPMIVPTISPLMFAQSENVHTYATGLNAPRGLKFGPDGFLYVAEGGIGGRKSTVGVCDQVPGPVGPYTGGDSARISRISPRGLRKTLVRNLPSSATAPDSGGFVSGVADIAFVGDQMYALLAGAGCSHGLAGTNNGLIQINSDGSWTLIDNLSAFQKAHPVANPNPGDFEPDGTWYSMTLVGNRIFAVEPNHGELDRMDFSGHITRVADISASQGHVVPASLAYAKGFFYVGNLGLFPVTPGSSNIFKIDAKTGDLSIAVSGLTTVLGLAFDNSGRLYALESMTTADFPGPDQAGTGLVVRIEDDGSTTTIATGLSFPTAMTFGPDGKLYVSNLAFGTPPGAGEIVQIDIP